MPTESRPSPTNPMLQAFVTPEGKAHEVTKIEFEKIGRKWRWTAWSRNRRLWTVSIEDQLVALLELTHVLLNPWRILDPEFEELRQQATAEGDRRAKPIDDAG